MKINISLLIAGIIILFIPIIFSEPGFNAGPGCDGSGCHTIEEGLVSLSVTDLQVEVTVSNTTSKVGGEFVDTSGIVVSVINSTNSNPFTLTAPGPGKYIVNAGFKNPAPRRWDSAMVNISVTDLIEANSIPFSYNLYNNHPNPLNPSTIIRYSLAEETFTSLIIYDAAGREITKLVDQVNSACIYQIIFNASALSSGIYF